MITTFEMSFYRPSGSRLHGYDSCSRRLKIDNEFADSCIFKSSNSLLGILLHSQIDTLTNFCALHLSTIVSLIKELLKNKNPKSGNTRLIPPISNDCGIQQ